MRDYITELKQYGLSLREIARETGIDHRRLSEISRGVKKITSKSPAYDKLRNLSRKIGYRIGKDAGLSSREASDVRRTIAKPTRRADTEQDVKNTRIGGNMVQYYVKALLQHTKTKRLAKAEGGSLGYPTAKAPPLHILYNQALNSCRQKLKETNWKLIHVIDHGYKTYNLKMG